MSDIKQYTPLKQVVAYALDECEKSIADFERCWVLGLRALVESNLDVSGEPITVRLPVSANKIVQLPTNCLQWSKVGILNDKGEIETLAINNALTTYKANSPDRLDALTPNVNSGDTNTYNNYFQDGNLYRLFGVGGGLVTRGACRVDERQRVIILEPNFAYDSILLEFLDCPEKNDDYQVLTCMQEAIIAFIKWKLKLGERAEYYAALTAGRRRLPKKRFILQEANQVIRESNSFKLRS